MKRQPNVHKTLYVDFKATKSRLEIYIMRLQKEKELLRMQLRKTDEGIRQIRRYIR